MLKKAAKNIAGETHLVAAPAPASRQARRSPASAARALACSPGRGLTPRVRFAVRRFSRRFRHEPAL